MSTIARLAEYARDDVVAAHVDSMRQFQQDLLQARAEYAALERRNAELVELLLEFISADSVACGHGYGIGDSDLIARCEAALAHTSPQGEIALPASGKQEKADAAE